jgi:hypothetical protein
MLLGTDQVVAASRTGGASKIGRFVAILGSARAGRLEHLAMSGGLMGCGSLLDQLAEVRASPGNKSALGSFGEAVAEIFLAEVLGHRVVFDEASRDKPQGIDLVTYDPERDRIVIVEVKTTSRERTTGPRLGRTTKTRQMSRDWIATGTASPSGRSRAWEAGLDQVQKRDVGAAVDRTVVHVNVAAGTVSLHEMDVDRVNRMATVTVDLEELVRAFDELSGNDSRAGSCE